MPSVGSLKLVTGGLGEELAHFYRRIGQWIGQTSHYLFRDSATEFVRRPESVRLKERNQPAIVAS